MRARALPTPKDEICDQQIRDMRARLSQRYVCFSQGRVEFRDSPPNLLGPGASRSSISATSNAIFADSQSCTGDREPAYTASLDHLQPYQEPTYANAAFADALSGVPFAGIDEAFVQPKALLPVQSSSRVTPDSELDDDAPSDMMTEGIMRRGRPHTGTGGLFHDHEGRAFSRRAFKLNSEELGMSKRGSTDRVTADMRFGMTSIGRTMDSKALASVTPSTVTGDIVLSAHAPTEGGPTGTSRGTLPFDLFGTSTPDA